MASQTKLLNIPHSSVNIIKKYNGSLYDDKIDNRTRETPQRSKPFGEEESKGKLRSLKVSRQETGDNRRPRFVLDWKVVPFKKSRKRL